jgi:hypothetical protein
MPAKRFRARELHLADGARLVMRTDGSIHHVEPGGTTERSWAPDDPEWPPLAMRFGIQVHTDTEVPSGRRVEATRPPRR